MGQGVRFAGAVPLEEIGDADGAAVGAKATALARMIRAGLPVPPGFCVTGGAHREHLDSNDLAARAAALLPELAAASAERRRKLLSEFREAVAAAPLSEAVEREIEARYRALGAGRVAVRSSATAEDLPEHSFAGQHDTYLNVAGLPGCLRAVRGCWASLWTERAFEYRERNGIDHLDVDMAVIVQELVPADAAGVIFTADPVTGRADRVVIEASFGLGEALVSGRVSPDRVVLSKKGLRILERTTSTKTVETVPDETGGVRERAVTPDRAGSPCIDDAVARRLGKLALRAEEAFGAAQDVEWAVSAGRPYILQSRPITAMPPQESWEDRQVWTNVNAAEVMPDVMTPMTCSVMERVVERLVGSFLHKLGVSLEGHPFAGVVAGRAYFNLNTVIACVRRIPGMGDESIAEFFGGRQDAASALGDIEIPEEDIPDVAASALAAVSRLPGFIVEFLSFSPSKGHRVLSQIREKTDALEGTDLRSLSERELAGLVRTAFADLLDSREMWELSGVVQTYETVLYDACRGWFGESGNAFASRLLSGLGNNENARAGLDLWRLAALAHDHPAVEAVLSGGGRFDEFRREVEAARAGYKFLAAWDSFLRDHGHHCRGEIELMNPRWSEEPEHILEQVRSYLRAVGGDDFFARYGRLSRERASTLEECRRRLWNPFKRLAFDFLLHQAQRCAPIRETLKSRVVRWLAAVRRLLLELGRRLASRGTLGGRDDVFFLRLEEIEPVSRGEAVADVRGMIAERRAEYERNLTVEPPPVVVGRFDPDAVVPEAIDENARSLTGVAANPGVVTGPARVILRAGTGRVEPGEILVAPFTDPGWTPYFLNAAAIVMDTGGILSHGSIIAREYGIPCVVNVGPATKIIETGRTVRVDGTRGEVRLLERAAPRAARKDADDNRDH